MGAIERAVNGNLCLGCGACAVAFEDAPVKMSVSAEGYLRPSVARALTPDEDHRVERICPGLGLSHTERNADFHPLWGPLLRVSTGYACSAKFVMPARLVAG